jgi:hypothetical protein
MHESANWALEDHEYIDAEQNQLTYLVKSSYKKNRKFE